MYSVYNKAEVAFKYVKEIGEDGKNSNAFIAHDRNLDAHIVIKQVEKKKINNPQELFDESRALYKSSHPNVVQIHYACECKDNIYLALPYYSNGSLKSLMDDRFLTNREIIRFGLHTLSALHNIHSKGLIHFDVKPDNILLSDRNEALLSDFGLARHLNEDALAQPKQIYVKHIAPEHFVHDQFDARYDIYQFGLTLYRMCNGNHFFNEQFKAFISEEGFNKDEYVKALNSESFPTREYKEHIPSKLSSIIEKCLKPSIEDRYTAAIDIANDLSTVSGNLLDWSYSIEGQADVWEKTDTMRTVRLARNHDGSSIAEKKTASGRWSRINEYCSDNLGKRETKRFLRRF